MLIKSKVDKEKEKKSKEATRRNEVAKSITDIIGLIGVVVDPTTQGVSDSNRALAYYKNGAI